MTTQSRSRVQRGIPTGGQFAHEQRQESAVSLAPTKDWGQLNLQEGSRTPWGPAQEVRHYADGIAVVSCAGHGGLKLSPERNREIPPALRRGSGWYEEDCDFLIAGMYFPEETRPRKELGYLADRDLDEWIENCRDSVRRWYPDEFEKVTGETVLPGQSSVRDRANWLAAHSDDWVTTSASSHPDGVLVTATRRGEEKRFIMPKDEYDDARERKELGSDYSVIVDPNRHRELPPEPVKPKTPAPRFRGIDTSKLTDLQRTRAENELYTRYRKREDDSVRTLRQIIEEEGITGKSAQVNNGKTEYRLTSQANVEDNSFYSYPVSKALWDAVDAPDERTPSERASQKANLAWERWQNAGWGERNKAKAAYEKLAQEADRLRTEERLAKEAAKG